VSFRASLSLIMSNPAKKLNNPGLQTSQAGILGVSGSMLLPVGGGEGGVEVEMQRGTKYLVHDFQAVGSSADIYR
jgi:hypothetical protein